MVGITGPSLFIIEPSHLQWLKDAFYLKLNYGFMGRIRFMFIGILTSVVFLSVISRCNPLPDIELCRCLFP